MDFAVELYRLTATFPSEERDGLIAQIRRAGVSISSNIAEGSGRGTTRDLVSFLTNSRGSLYESRSLLVVGQRVELLTSAALRPSGWIDGEGRETAFDPTDQPAKESSKDNPLATGH